MAKVALYRKYRSVNFDDLYGQDHITKTLKNAVKNGHFAHAYLFFGPRGTGKTSAARILAKAINCQHNIDGNPDGVCPICKLIDGDKTTDIIEIDAASHTQVDNIREIIVERAKFAPTNLKYKVYIIDEAHMLSKSSFNALLKTLEEPPEHAIFILATTEINKIIPTIQSRCQRFDFHRINEKALFDRLKYISNQEKINISDEAIMLIVRSSEGGFRDAISLLDQVADAKGTDISIKNVEALLGISDFSLIEDYVFAVIEKETSKALGLLYKALESGYEPTQFLKSTVEVLRRLSVASIAGLGEDGDLSEVTGKLYRDILKNVKTDDLIWLIDTYIKNDSLYKYSRLYQLSLEVATIKACVGCLVPTMAKGNGGIVLSQSDIAVKPKLDLEKMDDHGKWQHFLLEVKSSNNSIHAVLRVCEPEFTDSVVTLAFPYKFHKERIEDMKNRKVVEDTLTKVYGKKYQVKCVLRQSMTQKNQVVSKANNDDLLEDAVNIFGGEVID